MNQIDITKFENYQITDDGRVWSKNSEKYLTPFEVGGYLRVSLYRDGKCFPMFIHKLVADAFLPNPNNYQEMKIAMTIESKILNFVLIYTI